MKTIFLLLSFSLSLGAFAEKSFDVAERNRGKCNITNYKNFINNLSFCNFSGTNLPEEGLTDLRAKELRHTNLAYAVMAGVDASGVDFTNANLQGVDLRDTKVDGALFQNANLKYADLRGLPLRNMSLAGKGWWGFGSKQPQFEMFDAELENTKVTQEQADYLDSIGIDGYVVVSDKGSGGE